MKKTLILPLLFLATTLFAQKIDTTKTVPIHYNELVKINLQIQKSQILYHKFDIPALKRDTLDDYINSIYEFLNRRAQIVYADTVKKGKGK